MREQVPEQKRDSKSSQSQRKEAKVSRREYQAQKESKSSPHNGLSMKEDASLFRQLGTSGYAKSQESLLRLQRRFGNRYVQRTLNIARQGNGEAEVAPAIEHAIERSRGGGQMLDSKVRGQMESAFDSDFSGVRVHTDSNADALNRELIAKAFTTGKDIFFRQGEYQPGSSTGRELLAHELTHVIHQGGARIKGKLRVGQPNDSYEEEADQVARAVVQNETRLRRQIEEEEELQAKPATRLTSGQKDSLSLLPLIQRRRIRFPARWWGSAPSFTSDSNVWFDPRAELWLHGIGGLTRAQSSSFPGGNRTSFTLTPGARGVVRIAVNMGWFQDNILFNYSGLAHTIMDWDFTVTAGGELSLRGPSREEFTGGDGAQLVIPAPTLQSTTSDGGTIRVSPQILSAGSISAGASPGVAPGGIGGSVSATETTPRVSGWAQTFAVELIVPRPAAPLRTTYVTSVHFDVGSDAIEEGGERHVVGWYMGLPADVRRSIEDGNSTIILRGHASTTQPGPANRELSRRRAQRTRQILQDIAGSSARFRIYALGEYRARTADEVEESNERRVEIDVTYTPE